MKKVLVFGATSDLAQALIHLHAKNGDELYLAARNVLRLKVLQQDLELKYNINVVLIEFDALDFMPEDFSDIAVVVDLIYCIFGYLGNTENALNNTSECEKILATNFNASISVLNYFALKLKERKSGIIVGVSSVAGERGRQSNFIYGAAKSGFTTYLSGLRNYLHQSRVHVLTVKPGFMYTQMTKDLELPKLISAAPDKAAKTILRAVEKRKDVIYVLPIWRFIMLAIKIIPEFIFKRLNL